MTTTIQIYKNGKLTIPKEFLERYNLNEGDTLSITDLGDGSFLIFPQVSQVNRLGERIPEILKEEKISMADLLKTLAEEREDYYQDHYSED